VATIDSKMVKMMQRERLAGLIGALAATERGVHSLPEE
jgi:hypothetical protein